MATLISKLSMEGTHRASPGDVYISGPQKSVSQVSLSWSQNSINKVSNVVYFLSKWIKVKWKIYISWKKWQWHFLCAQHRAKHSPLFCLILPTTPWGRSCEHLLSTDREAGLERFSDGGQVAQPGSGTARIWTLEVFPEPLVLTTVHCLPHSNPCVGHMAAAPLRPRPPPPPSSLNALRVAAPSGLQLTLARD